MANTVKTFSSSSSPRQDRDLGGPPQSGREEMAIPLQATGRCKQYTSPPTHPRAQIHCRRDVSTPSSTSSPKKLQTASVLSQSSRLFFFAEQAYEGSHHQLPQPPSCNGKGEGVHRSAQRHRATELCPHSLAFRSSTLYLLVTWNEKIKNKQTTHTIQAHAHWDGSCRIT